MDKRKREAASRMLFFPDLQTVWTKTPQNAFKEGNKIENVINQWKYTKQLTKRLLAVDATWIPHRMT